MLNFKFKKSLILVCALLLQPLMSPGSFAWAKKRAPKAYSFIVEGGKASQGECDGEGKIPRKLKHLKEFSKSGSYMGSELQAPEIKGKTDDEMWKHFFRVKASCNTALAKTPSLLSSTQLNTKPELPPDDSVDSDGEGDQKDGPDSD